MASKTFEAPVPGTFFRKPAPHQPPFKGEGENVAVGDTVGLIEVMKTFTPVVAEVAGRLLAFHVRTLFVANRGEIAVRIIRAAKALGMRTVQAASSADREMLAARMADEIAEIGPPHATKSHLNKEAVVAAAVASGADAVHPGYGFLSENADFAAMVESAGLVFVGPRPETIRAMGDKVWRARWRRARACRRCRAPMDASRMRARPAGRLKPSAIL
jgi:acetyl/propionyl-CoA carboxylase alpha subunit